MNTQIGKGGFKSLQTHHLAVYISITGNSKISES